MTSDNTAPFNEAREGQDHEDRMKAWLGAIRFARVMRLVCGVGVPLIAVMGVLGIVQTGGDPAEIGIAIGGTAIMAGFSYFAGRQANRIQTRYDQATTTDR